MSETPQKHPPRCIHFGHRLFTELTEVADKTTLSHGSQLIAQDRPVKTAIAGNGDDKRIRLLRLRACRHRYDDDRRAAVCPVVGHNDRWMAPYQFRPLALAKVDPEYSAPHWRDHRLTPRSGRSASTRRWLRCSPKKAATDAKITRRVWLHQLRHTAGTRAAEMGLSSLEVAAILGHAQASTSERYIHLARGVDADRAEEIAARTLGL
jgi:integrase